MQRLFYLVDFNQPDSRNLRPSLIDVRVARIMIENTMT